jgi:hypothetical protein
MKLKYGLNSLTSVLVVALVGSTPVFAKQSRTVRLPYAGSLNGTPLATGEYKLSWEQHSAEATVTVTQGKDVVATAPAKWVARDVRYSTNQVFYNINPDGSRTILEIRFAGLKGALVFHKGSPAT